MGYHLFENVSASGQRKYYHECMKKNRGGELDTCCDARDGALSLGSADHYLCKLRCNQQSHVTVALGLCHIN